MSSLQAAASPSAAELPAHWWSRLGHDLRGSVGPMRMAVQLLRSGRMAPAEQDEALQLIDRQIDLLLSSIDDLSDLLRLSAGTLVLNLAPNDLNLALDIVSGRGALRTALEARQQTLKTLPDESEVVTRHDPARVAALLEFLVRKSAEHAAPGAELTLGLRRESGRAHLHVAGAEPVLALDPEVAQITGAASGASAELGAKPLLLRELARLNDIEFETVTDQGIHCSMPLLVERPR